MGRVPAPTRRVLTMEWVSGVKLTTLEPAEIRGLVKVGQEAFLTQLLEIGFFHGDPHPGNLLKVGLGEGGQGRGGMVAVVVVVVVVTEGPHAGKLALLDFGLVAEIPPEDRQAMVSATIHLANRDWSALLDDFVALGFLPPNPDRALIIPVMDRDLLAATLEIPFSVPPYMSLLARSVATLEGIALAGDPQYAMVAQAYPFVARKVATEVAVEVADQLAAQQAVRVGAPVETLFPFWQPVRQRILQAAAAAAEALPAAAPAPAPAADSGRGGAAPAAAAAGTPASPAEAPEAGATVAAAAAAQEVKVAVSVA
ncbi:hypothetical protein GPECTOR_46g235 [Gonium pectorale]|uniref:ABC1 atypical kinase-like domain-containing protein n=1 Tax=Gonium pectorale TaxID=33097 RepID=A0A150G8H7_GONPE|nr:hypothetical protein GPECTOR_46g235 [Gonium pectorale]|eukprot:KXZ46166.1 hypothetical protein GPECTOR_46g235 [Gonium pectorale]